MPPRKTSNESEEFRLRRSMMRWGIAAQILTTLIRACAACFCLYMVYLTVDSLAGKTTSADLAGEINLKFLANRYASQIIFALFGTSGIVYGLRQQSLYKKAVKKLRRVKTYEMKLDPKRSTTGLEQGYYPGDEP